MGERKQAKGRVSRRPTGQATLWAPPTPAEPATCRTSHPSGTCLAGTISAVSGSGQGCRGRSPRRNKLWDSPFPPGRGAGGWGKESKLKARLADDQPGKPPFGHRQRPPPRRPAGQTTPSGTTVAGIAGKQKGAPRGTCVPRGAPRARKPGKLLNYLLSFLITRLS